ncbi:hypothetical protein [Isoalcanivorax beigongshangi]|uniref:Uncharacterized protein n=1 Tax=Isoalcanivorax beigongshangi TaxID=3238810 RepID=A0ABV4AHC6_9GAMM
MADLHIDDFCRDAALVLLHLYSSFPRPLSLYVEDICGPQSVDEVGLHSKRHMACLATMLWLAEEGYLRHEGLIYQEGIEQSVLTSKAFVQLSSLAVTADRRWVDQLRETWRGGHSEALSLLVHQFIALPGAVPAPASRPTPRRDTH